MMKARKSGYLTCKAQLLMRMSKGMISQWFPLSLFKPQE
jgi:hypothetical protein